MQRETHTEKIVTKFCFVLLIAAWFNTVQAFESLGLIAVMLCIVAEVYMDFLSKPSPDRRLVELLALLAGMISSFLMFIVLP